ncbi:unnamed protein product [Durusdinium trenchii]|uniref:Uncharacterized protein n=1 Tax=Durusdinium trenchii TaxID=1381693 RepID=A0ABP0NTQ1_9DINO
MNVFNTLTVQLLNIFTFHVFLCWFTTLLKFATLMNRCLQELCFYAHGSAEEGGRGRETRIYFLSLVPGLTSDDINDEDGFQLDVLHLKKDDGRCGGLPTVENGSGILQDSSGFLARPTSTVLTPCRSSRSYEL